MGQIYRRYPLKAALDGGFASKDTLKIAKAKNIEDVCFAEKRGLKEEDMCRMLMIANMQPFEDRLKAAALGSG